MCIFLSSMAYLEGFGPDGVKKPAKERVKERLESAYVKGIKANLCVWPWVQLLNFSVVPLPHRLLVVNAVAIPWNCYLSFLNSSGGESEKKHQTKEDVVSDAEKEVVKT